MPLSAANQAVRPDAGPSLVRSREGLSLGLKPGSVLRSLPPCAGSAESRREPNPLPARDHQGSQRKGAIGMSIVRLSTAQSSSRPLATNLTGPPDGHSNPLSAPDARTG